jgi:hypothetical protein
MSTSVSIKDVAAAACVSKSTVSRVINGKGNSTRICPTTQARVLAVAQQLGYQTNLLAQNISLGRGTGLGPNLPNQEASRKLANFICLVLSTTSPIDALALIPSLDPVLTRAGYRLIVITVPDDPEAGQARVAELLTAGVAGLLCCPTLYPTVLKTVAGTRPVIVLWAGAAKAVVSVLNGECVEQDAQSNPVATPVTETPSPVVAESITPITPTTHAQQPQPGIMTKPVIATPPPTSPPLIPPPPLVVTETTPPASTPEPPPTILPEAPSPASEPEPSPQIQDPVVSPVETPPPVSPPSIPTPSVVVAETPPLVLTPEPEAAVIDPPSTIPRTQETIPGTPEIVKEQTIITY